jgi:hypothetical protein
MNKKIPLLKKPSLLNIPIFLFFPFIAFLISLRHLNTKTNAVIFVLFCILFGYAFTFQFDSADSYRIALVFHEFDYDSITDVIPLYLLGITPDLYEFFSFTLIKKFSNNPKMVFAFFGLVFGVFWYLSLGVFTKEKGSTTDFYIHLLFFIFLIFNPITNVNGVRFNTAIWIFFYAAINIVLYNKKRYLFLLFLTPLIHFSFLIPSSVIVVFYSSQRILFSKDKINTFLYFLFVFSFVVSWILETNIINLDFLSSVIPSDSISNKIDKYNSDEMTELYQKRASESIFLKVSSFFLTLLKICVFFFIVYTRKLLKKIKEPNPLLNKLLAFVLFYFSFAFIISTLPSGTRFLMIGYLFFIIFILKLYLKYGDRTIKNYILLLLPILSFKFFFNVVFLSFTLTSPTIWYGNVFWIIYEGIGFTFSYI